MPVERAAQLAGQVFDALAHAHRAGVVHRDLKPANLMLTESGLVKIMDFGLARMAGTEHLTNDGYMLGTPAYMSPEQVLGWEIDGRADLYAMGRPLPAAHGAVAVQRRQRHRDGAQADQRSPTPVRQLRTELSWEVEEVLKKALAKPPGDRYQTADEFKAAFSASVAARRADRAPRRAHRSRGGGPGPGPRTRGRCLRRPCPGRRSPPRLPRRQRLSCRSVRRPHLPAPRGGACRSRPASRSG